MPLAESDHATTPAAPVAVQTEAPQPAPAPRAATAPRSTAARFPYVAQPEWLPTQSNYWEGRGGASIDYIVIHYTDISYARTLRAFSIRASDVSAHYVIRGDGHIAQIVGEADTARSEEHTSELQSQSNLVCRLLLEKKKNKKYLTTLR